MNKNNHYKMLLDNLVLLKTQKYLLLTKKHSCKNFVLKPFI